MRSKELIAVEVNHMVRAFCDPNFCLPSDLSCKFSEREASEKR